MKKYYPFASVIIGALLLAAGCQKAAEQEADNPYHFKSEEASTVLTKAEGEMVVGSNSFGFNVAKQMVTMPEYQSGSFVFSPLSATVLLGMLEEGAEGETAESISQVLGFGSNGREQINQFCRNMIVIADNSQDATVNMANAIMLNQGNALKDNYLKSSTEYYDAKCAVLDFSQSSSLDYINNWAAEKTHGLIPKLFDVLDPVAVAYLMNALYFKSAWEEPFIKTEPYMDFHKEDGSTSMVEMMSQTSYFSYSESDALQKLTLPYKNGAYRMDILLPREGYTIAETMGILGTDEWKALASSTQKARVEVSIPSFSTAAHIELLPILQSLGLKSFSGFSRIADDVHFNGIFQKAKIIVDKKGTEAAAITTTSREIAPIPGEEEPDPVIFRADKPFIYLITEKTTGAILFIGTYMGR